MALIYLSKACTPDTFSGLSIFGADILSLNAEIVSNYTLSIPEAVLSCSPSFPLPEATFCNVTVTYTHPNKHDSINAEIWLPSMNWNGRLQSIGGGGWVAGRSMVAYPGMVCAISDGFATATTDAGLGTAGDFELWGLVSPGNVNLDALDNFGQTSLNDLAIIAKDIVKDYYGQGPVYSYWNGCSNGGRQASILAQQYPDAYDGIYAAAPAMYWAEVAIGSVWPAFYMELTKQYPQGCELTKITSLAIAECDLLDNVEDGLIADPEKCFGTFKPHDYVGTSFICAETGKQASITPATVNVAQALWAGPKYSNGDFMWYGLDIGTDLSALAGSTCTNNGTCTPSSRASLEHWWRYWILKDPSADVPILTHAQFDQMYRTLKKAVAPVAATEPRISDFRRMGGKMITYHGLADAAIAPGGTLSYYQEVSSILDNVTDFFRYYRVPGLGHCYGGSGGQPYHLFNQLRTWVENGTAPGASPVTVHLPNNATKDEVLCPYPQEAIYQQSCSNRTSSLGCWSCK